MRPELESLLFERYPKIYRHRSKEQTRASTNESSLTYYGFSCDDGWFDIIDTASAKLETLANENEKLQEFYVSQVKNKFGDLRIYTSHEGDKDVARIIQKAYADASKTCDRCGRAKNGRKCDCTNLHVKS